MRAHLPAWVAFVSLTGYVACGSADDSKALQEGGAGGEAGDGGAGPSAGGSNASAGSSNGGSMNPGGGEGGAALGGAPAAGSGGAAAGQGGAPGMGGAGDAGGAGGSPDETGFPSACPGVVGDYLQLDGTIDDDVFAAAQEVGQVLIYGLAGNDTFEADSNGADCLIGGPGNDDFSAAGEASSFLVGGSGADTFHISGFSFSSTIVDMNAEDTIGLSLTNYDFLAGQAGDPPAADKFFVVPAYEAGTGVVPAGTGSVLVYDPATGGVFIDFNRGVKGDGANQDIVRIVNHAAYTFDLNDFVLE